MPFVNKILLSKFLSFLMNSEGSLYEKVIRGGFWMFFLRFLTKILQFVKIVVLARLLSPDDFGLFGISLVIISAMDVVLQFGFNQALIQKKENIKPYLNTVWTIGIIKGLAVAIFLFITAGHFALFFKNPEIEIVIKVFSVAVLIKSLINPSVVYFEKELRFKEYFKYNFIPVFFEVIIAIFAAFLLKNVWALIIGFFVGNIIKFILSHEINWHRPKLELDFSKAKELWIFGRWIFFLSILGLILSQGDDVFVGWILGLTALGFYQMAFRVAFITATDIASTISEITFPAYSKIQDDRLRLKKAYLKTLKFTSFISFLFTGLMFILVDDFTILFFTNKWDAIIPVVKVFVVFGLVGSFQLLAYPILFALKMPNKDTKWQLVRLLVLAVLIYPFTITWGIFGTALSCLISILVLSIGSTFETLKAIECEVKIVLKIIGLQTIITIMMIISVFSIKLIIPTSILSLILFITIGVVVYIISTIYLWNKFYKFNIRNLIKSIKLFYS